MKLRPPIFALLAFAFLSPPAQAFAATEHQLLDRGACTALVAGQAADAISSFVSQARGGVEMNPVLGRGQRPVARIVVAKTAAVAIEAWLMRASARRGHRTFAKVIGYAAGGLGAAYAVKNINGLR
jgi:hypothetical protein